MAYNFVVADRDQQMLMPPSVAEWLPEDHLAFFVLDVVGELDLSAFVAAYRPDGRGGAAYDPALMVALLVYAYSVGERSSRQIERRCLEDIAFRVVAANQQPDHATIARFRAAHETALGALFGQVLALCARAGVLRPGLVAIDGTKLAANASRDANRSAEQLAAEILAEAAATDEAEDAQAQADGEAELPEDLRTRGGRRQRLRELLDELEAEAESKSYEAQMARRAETEARTGRPMKGRRPVPTAVTHRTRRQANTTDPDSRMVKTRDGFIQGYNAQAVATEDQFIVAAEVTNNGSDVGSFAPMVKQAKTNLRRAGERRRVRRVVADAGYWSADNAAHPGIEPLIAPGRARDLGRIADQDSERAALLDRIEAGELDNADAAEALGVTTARVRQLLRRRRQGQAETLTTAMMAKLASPQGRRLYSKRAASIEPVFGQIKHNRGMASFMRRGLSAVDSEWKLIAATHNLLKLWRLNPGTA